MNSRRSFLTGCGAVLAGSALSGCGLLDSGGGSGRSRYTDWTFEPGQAFASVHYTQPSTIANIVGAPEEIREFDIFGIAQDTIDHYLTFQGSLQRYEGSFTADEFRTGYEESWEITFEADGERSGYQLYTAKPYAERIGLKDGEAVMSNSGEFETFLDAGTGDTDTLADVNENFDLLTSELGVSHRVHGIVKLSSDAESIPMEDGQVAIGSSTEFGSEGTNHGGVAVFESEDAVDIDSVVDNVEDRDEVTDLTSSEDGRVVTYSYRTTYE